MKLRVRRSLVSLLMAQFCFGSCFASASSPTKDDFVAKLLRPELQVTPTNGPAGASVVMFAEQADEIYAATKSGLYVSQDLGDSWTAIDRDEVRNKEIAEVKAFGELLLVRVGDKSFCVRPKLQRWIEIDRNDFYPEGFVQFQSNLYAIGYSGIYSSPDAQNWNLIAKLSTQRLGSLKGLFTDSHALYAIVSQEIRRNEDPLKAPKNWIKVADVDGTIVPPNGVTLLPDGNIVVATEFSLWTSNDEGKKWLRTSTGVQGYVFPITSVARHLLGCVHQPQWSDPPRCILQSNDDGKSWIPLSDIPGTSSFSALLVLSDQKTVLLGGSDGAYRSTTGGAPFRSANRGLGEQNCVRVFLSDGILYSATSDGLFSSADLGKDWQEVPFQGDYNLDYIVRVGKVLFAQASRRTDDFANLQSAFTLFIRANDKQDWAEVKLNNNTDPSINDILPVGDHLFVASDYALYIVAEDGSHKEVQVDGQIRHLTSFMNRLFAVVRSRRPEGNSEDQVVEVDTEGKVVRRYTEGLKIPYINEISTNDSYLFVGTAVGGLFYLNLNASDDVWHPLTAANLTGDVNSIWLDPAHSAVPSVIVAGTSDGLFYSSDSGATFAKAATPVTFGAMYVSSMIRLPNSKFVFATNHGVVVADDNIRRGSAFTRILLWLNGHRWFSYSTIAIIGVLVFGSSRLLLLVLQLEIAPITRIAPAFYLTPFGKWKLFRRYLRDLAQDLSFREAERRFSELPYATTSSARTTNGSIVRDEGMNVGLADATFQAAIEGHVVITADGGKGKSTLCRLLVTCPRSLIHS